GREGEAVGRTRGRERAALAERRQGLVVPGELETRARPAVPGEARRQRQRVGGGETRARAGGGDVRDVEPGAEHVHAGHGREGPGQQQEPRAEARQAAGRDALTPGRREVLSGEGVPGGAGGPVERAGGVASPAL